MTYQESRDHLMKLGPKPRIVMVRGEGSSLWDDTGRRYLDFVQGWAVNTLGHAPPVIARTIAEQANTLISPSPAYYNAPALELASMLVDASGLSQVFFCNSGAEANEGAIKLARKWGKLHRSGAHEVITTVDSFHGRTLATMAATGKAGWDDMFPPKMPGFVKVPFGDASAVEAAITERTAAVLVEPIQGEAGVVMPPAGYLRDLRAIADARGILFMCDEVQTGVGRTGTLFAHQSDGVLPDVMTLGKGIGGGVPLAALLATDRAACFSPGEQGGTFNGNPLCASVGISVLRAVTAPGFLEAVRERGASLQRGLGALGPARGIVRIRGRGLLVAAELDAPRGERVRDRALELGLLLNSPRPALLRFMPALNVAEDAIAEMLGILERALTDTR
jgi:acetylornithine/N-succinyldiaminopimelate aminotransferase